MNILVIGGTKFIGVKVVELLLLRGHDVTLFHRGHHEEQLPARVQHLHGEKANMRANAQVFRRRNFDIVIDMIADNDDDANQVVEIFEGRIKLAIYLSSQNVYSPWGALHGLAFEELPIPFPEISPLRREMFLYRGKGGQGGKGETYEKILMEHAVMNAAQGGNFPACILRLPAVYGPRDYQAREYPFIKRVLDQRPHIVLGRGASWLWQRGYVDDMAMAIVLAAEQPDKATGQIFNVGHRQVWTIEKLAHQVARLMNWQWEVHSVPDEILAPDALFYPKLPHVVTDTEKIRRVLGWTEEVSLMEGLQQAVEWHLANPPDLKHLPYSFDYELEDQALTAYFRLIDEGRQAREEAEEAEEEEEEAEAAEETPAAEMTDAAEPAVVADAEVAVNTGEPPPDGDAPPAEQLEVQDEAPPAPPPPEQAEVV